ncbi:DUF2946 family protein [Stenotrophomonas maltophilia]|uniref:DUF2946 family protein n=1 Tax=Stenotrophomonas maltophilia TaxID=40324 RepID=UPI003017C27E
MDTLHRWMTHAALLAALLIVAGPVLTRSLVHPAPGSLAASDICHGVANAPASDALVSSPRLVSVTAQVPSHADVNPQGTPQATDDHDCAYCVLAGRLLGGIPAVLWAGSVLPGVCTPPAAHQPLPLLARAESYWATGPPLRRT